MAAWFYFIASAEHILKPTTKVLTNIHDRVSYQISMEGGSDFAVYGIGFALRIALMNFNLFGLSERTELATPLNSYKRLSEGVVLYKHGVDPYAGVLFHETPIVLHIFTFLMSNVSETMINLLFVFLEMLTAWILGRFAHLVAASLKQKQSTDVKNYHIDAKENLLIDVDELEISKRVQEAYLLHPFLMASCAARTTTVLANLLLALFLWSAMVQWTTFACLCLALATYQNFYPLMLVVPLILMTKAAEQNLVKVTLQVLVISTVCLGSLFYLSYVIMDGSWTFVQSTTGFILSVPELTPNMGLFWYFFTEMFEHFRIFFVCIFQLNCFVYVYPLATRLQSQPHLLVLSLLALTAIFKSYPSYGDVGFYLALLPTASYLFPYMRQNFIVANTLVATSVLGPVLYQLWIYNGSANANFFFAITLVYNTAQIFLVTDLLFANVKRECFLKSGYKQLKSNDENAPMLKLQ